MNQRIRELIEQNFIITTDGKISHVNDYMAEKFAESIVRECVATLDEADGSIHHRECLFEHFGVEE
jgi:hypothetical protein